VQLDGVGLIGIEAGRDQIEILFNPMRFSLKHRHTGKNKIALRGIPDRSGFVDVQEMHGGPK
jgi:hypothetical protein